MQAKQGKKKLPWWVKLLIVLLATVILFLGFSYGMATINTGGDPDDLLSMMDSRMYEMKQERKKQISKAAE